MFDVSLELLAMSMRKTGLWRSSTALPQAPLLREYLLALFCLIVLAGIVIPNSALAAERFEGCYFSGEGDIEYLQLLDTARRMFDSDTEFQNIAMLYNPSWNGFVEGPKWGAWWIQNSYGPTYCVLPFLTEPYITFLQNAQDLWFDKIGDGKTSRSFGSKKLYLSTIGAGPVTAVKLNDRDWKSFDNKSIHLPYEQTPVIAYIQIALGGAYLAAVEPMTTAESTASLPTGAAILRTIRESRGKTNI